MRLSIETIRDITFMRQQLTTFDNSNVFVPVPVTLFTSVLEGATAVKKFLESQMGRTSVPAGARSISWVENPPICSLQPSSSVEGFPAFHAQNYPWQHWMPAIYLKKGVLNWRSCAPQIWLHHKDHLIFLSVIRPTLWMWPSRRSLPDRDFCRPFFFFLCLLISTYKSCILILVPLLDGPLHDPEVGCFKVSAALVCCKEIVVSERPIFVWNKRISISSLFVGEFFDTAVCTATASTSPTSIYGHRCLCIFHKLRRRFASSYHSYWLGSIVDFLYSSE